VPTVSVCIPSYNHAAYLPAAIESALGQTYRDLEVVIVDDGSTDDSHEIARAYERREPERVRVFTHPGNANRGISETANLARQQSRGSIWSGLPSDDVLHLDRIARLMTKLARHPELDLVYSYARVIDKAGQPLRERGLFGVDITRERHPVDHLIPGNLIPGMTVLARRDSLERVGHHEEGIVYSDWELWVRVFASLRVGFVPAVLVDYRIHGTNTSQGVDPSLQLPRHLDVVETLEAKIDTVPGMQRPRFRALLGLEHAYLDFCAGRLEVAKHHLIAAFDHEPGLRESPAPLGYFLTRWESDTLHPYLPADSYVQFGATLRRTPPHAIWALAPKHAPANFALWVLSAQPQPASERAAREWLRLVAAVQYAAAAVQCRRAGSSVRAAVLIGEALRTYPRLLSGMTPGSLLSRELQPNAVKLIELGRNRVGARA